MTLGEFRSITRNLPDEMEVKIYSTEALDPKETCEVIKPIEEVSEHLSREFVNGRLVEHNVVLLS